MYHSLLFAAMASNQQWAHAAEHAGRLLFGQHQLQDHRHRSFAMRHYFRYSAISV
jgi:hypothetical protein